MSSVVGKLCRPFSKAQKIVNKFEITKFGQKSGINLRRTILIFSVRRNWKTIGKGYIEMGIINSELSEYGFRSVLGGLVKYEIRLSESDKIDDYDGGEKGRHILC